MQTISLAVFLADAEMRARRCGVADLPVDSLRNKGGGRTANKRALLAAAGAGTSGGAAGLVSYF